MNELDWEKLWREAEGKEEPEAEQPETEACEAEQPEESEREVGETPRRNKRFGWVITVAAILCAAVIALCAAGPKQPEGSPFGRLYTSSHVIYDTDWIFGEDSVHHVPIIITEDGRLSMMLTTSYYDVVMHEWLSGTTFTEIELTRENFDDLFKGRSYDWETDDTAKSLRKDNLRAWVYGDDFASTPETDYPNLYLMLQEDGAVLLAYWDGQGEDAAILSVVELGEATLTLQDDQ